LANKDDKRPEVGQQNTGQVQHDDRGNAVWHWAADTARTAMASTSQLLRKLDLTGLSLESEAGEEVARPEASPAKPASSAAASDKSKKKSSIDSRKVGFDPYSTNAGTAKRAAPAAAAKAAMKAPGVKPAPAAAPNTTRPDAPTDHRSSWWRRLLGRD
jgi:hypothetical protein